MTLSSRIQSAKKPNVQIIEEMDALLSHPSEAFVWAFVAVCPYLYPCPYLPGLALYDVIILYDDVSIYSIDLFKELVT